MADKKPMNHQAMLDSLPFGVMITDKDLHIIGINCWITEQRLMGNVDCQGSLITDLFSEIKERGLQAIYELVLESEQKITISNRIHKYFLKMPGRAGSGLDYMPQTAVVAPLFVGQDLNGTITIITDVSERVITEQLLTREIDKLSILHSVDQALAILDFRACLDVIVTKTQTHFFAEGIAVFLVEEQQLKQAAGTGLSDILTPPANSLAVWCFEQRKPKMIKYGRKSLPLIPFICLIPGAQTEMAAPLIIGDVCIGVIQASISQTREYDKYDLELLEGLAAHAAAAIQNARLHEESEYWRKHHQRTSERLQTLLNAVRLMSRSADLLQILNSVTEFLGKVFHADYVVIQRPETRSDCLVSSSQWGNDQMPLQNCTGDLTKARQIFSTDGKSKNYADLNQLIFFSEDYRKSLLKSGFCRLMSVGLSVRDTFAGVILVFSSDPEREFSQEEQELFEGMAAQLNLAIENGELYAQQQKLAVTDGLTGVFNRRQFDQELEIWIKRTQRYQHPISLIIMDIDNFKRFNDTFGHQTGDDVLKLLADIIMKSVRSVDIVARYGGEEFVVIMPDTAVDEAVLTAERLRIGAMSLLKAAKNPLVRNETLTISVGVASAPFHAQESQTLLKTADQFLYKAKQTGKNRVVSSG